MSIKKAEKHLEELQSKVVKGSKAKTVSSPVTPNANKPTNNANKPTNNPPPGTVKNVTTNNTNA